MTLPTSATGESSTTRHPGAVTWRCLPGCGPDRSVCPAAQRRSQRRQTRRDHGREFRRRGGRPWQAPVRLLIHGHTHRPAVHAFVLDGHVARRIVLGAWYEQGSVLTVSGPDAELKIIAFP